MTTPAAAGPDRSGQDPRISFAFDPEDSSGRTVIARCDQIRRGGTVLLHWDDQGAVDELSAAGQTAVRVYGGEGHHLLQAHYRDGRAAGAAWVLPVPKGRGSAPISLLLVRRDVLDPLSVWGAWVNPGASRYSLDWGDGSTTPDIDAGRPPQRHTYSAPGVYTVTGIAGSARVSTQITVGDGARPPVVLPPVVGLARWRHIKSGQWQVLFAPDEQDHGHHIDWGNGEREVVPPGTAYVARGAGSEVVVTDTTTGKSITVHPRPEPVRWLYFGDANVRKYWHAKCREVLDWDLYLDDRLIPRSPDNGRYETRLPYVYGAHGLNFVKDGRIIAQMPCWMDENTAVRIEGEPLYDFDPRHPNLITVKPNAHEYSIDSSVQLRVDWGDGTPPGNAEHMDIAGWDVWGLHTSHWYTGSGRRTLAVSYKRGPFDPLTARIMLGPTTARLSRPAASTRRLTLTLPDPRTPVRVDWGDGTLPLLCLPGGSGSGDAVLEHTYSASGTYTITVHAPLQAPLVFDGEIVRVEHQLRIPRRDATSLRGDVSWSGRLEFDSADGTMPSEVRDLLPPRGCGGGWADD